MKLKDLNSLNWTTISEIANSGELSCIDGRHSHCVVGAPGGNIGEMILMLAVAERLSGIQFTAEQLEQLLANYASSFGRFYMHTDTHAVQRLMETAANDSALSDWVSGFNSDVHAFFDGLLELDKSRSEHMLQYLLMPRHVGCGHLKLLLQESETYQVCHQLVSRTMASFYRLMWLGNNRMHWEMLEGDHQEEQVVVIDADEELQDESAIPYACKHEGAQWFVNHSAVRRFFHKRGAQFISKFMSYQNLPSIDLDLYVDEISKLADKQLSNTLTMLASDLPMVKVVVTGDGVTVENAA